MSDKKIAYETSELKHYDINADIYFHKKTKFLAVILYSIGILSTVTLMITNIIYNQISFLITNAVILIIIFTSLFLILNRNKIKLGLSITIYSLLTIYIIGSQFINENMPEINLLSTSITCCIFIIAGGFFLKRYHIIILTIITLIYIVLSAIKSTVPNIVSIMVNPTLMMITGAVFMFYFVGLFNKIINISECRRETLNESRRKYYQLFSKMSNAFSYNKMLVKQGEVKGYKTIEVNPVFFDFFDIDTKNLIDKQVSDILPKLSDFDENIINALNNIHKNGGEQYIEYNFKDTDKWYLINIYSPENNYFAMLVKDISERKVKNNRLLNTLKEKEVLLKEIHHRVKNNLQIIISILRLQSRTAKDDVVAEQFKLCQDRIKSMAIVHEDLYRTRSMAYIDMKKYFSKLIKNIQNSHAENFHKIRIDINVPENLVLDIDHAVPLGLITNEIITNSFKHAFPDDRSGKITIRMDKTDDFSSNGGFILEIKDTGIGLDKDKIPKTIGITGSLGMGLIYSLTDQLKGDIQVDGENGTHIKLIIPKIS